MVEERGILSKIYGAVVDDRVHGTAAHEVFDTGLGNDTINAQGGDDTIKGGPGDDTITPGSGKDKIYIQGHDTIYDFDREDVMILPHAEISGTKLDSEGNIKVIFVDDQGETHSATLAFTSLPDGVELQDVFQVDKQGDQTVLSFSENYIEAYDQAVLEHRMERLRDRTIGSPQYDPNNPGFIE